jgi:hypothetical protein
MLPPEVPEFPNLPAILKWEISLAVLVLAWSLLSLGRFERLKRRRRARRQVPTNVIRLHDGRLSVGIRSGSSRSLRIKALLVATGFAVVAASFAYAMPNIVTIKERREPRRRAAPTAEVIREGSGPTSGRDRDRPDPAATASGESEGALAPEEDTLTGSLGVTSRPSSGESVEGTGAEIAGPVISAATPTPGVAATPSPSVSSTPLPSPTSTPGETPSPEPTPE